MRFKKLKQNLLKEIIIFKKLKNKILENKYQRNCLNIKELQPILKKIQKKIILNNLIIINDLYYFFSSCK